MNHQAYLEKKALGSVLVPVDFSRFSRAALECAFKLAPYCRGPIEVLHVWGLEGEAEPLAARERVAALVAEVPGAVAVDFCVTVDRGAPAARILSRAAARNVELIVMGAHGETHVTGLRLGATAELVSLHAQCLVVTVQGDGVELGDEIIPWFVGASSATVETAVPLSDAALDLARVPSLICPNSGQSKSPLECLGCAQARCVCISLAARSFNILCKRA